MDILWHSDDIGATPTITSRIIEAWESGLLDGFSIIANGDNLDAVSEALKRNEDRDGRIVVHLNICEGKPVLPPEEVSLLVDDDGYFKIGFLGMLKRYRLGSDDEKKALMAQVEREWRRQIETVLKAVTPRKVNGVDGHIHIHMLPFLFDIACSLSKEFGFGEIRMCREPYFFSTIPEIMSARFVVNTLKNCVLNSCVPADIKIAEKFGIKHPNAMIGILYSGMMSESNVMGGIYAAEKMGVERFEILMHIGRAADNELDMWKGDRKAASYVLSPNRDAEYEALKKLRAEL